MIRYHHTISCDNNHKPIIESTLDMNGITYTVKGKPANLEAENVYIDSAEKTLWEMANPPE